MLGGAITITIDGEAATLRPSLRAAYTLERKHGFPAIYAGINEGNTAIISDVVNAGIVAGSVSIMQDIAANGVCRLDVLQAPLLAFVAMLIGVEARDQTDAPAKGNTKSDTVSETFAAYYERLFGVGTGWLGWSPEQTWQATPAEIVAAQKGRAELLRAIFGGKDQKPDKRTLADKVSSVMASLGARIVKRGE